jgi:hypothetical protein
MKIVVKHDAWKTLLGNLNRFAFLGNLLVLTRHFPVGHWRSGGDDVCNRLRELGPFSDGLLDQQSFGFRAGFFNRNHRWESVKLQMAVNAIERLKTIGRVLSFVKKSDVIF